MDDLGVSTRQKLILDVGQLHQVLGLPDNVRLVEISREPERLGRPEDPVLLHVVFEGAPLPPGWRLPSGTL